MGVPPACHVPRPAILAKQGHPCTLSQCITSIVVSRGGRGGPDSCRFDSLGRNVFPGVPFRDVEYMKLDAALSEASKELNLPVIKAQVDETGHEGL